jgi:putative membrane protein insertion efficiency factor
MGFGPALRDAPRRGLIALVRGYRFFLSPWLGSACRFEPTCSAYALQALQQHGATAGAVLSLGRLARCHPFCAGGHDPVPADPPRLFSRLIPLASRRSLLSSSFREKNTP